LASWFIDTVAVMAVGDRVDDRHRAGQREFQLVRSVAAGGTGFVGVDAVLQRQRRHHLRHHRLVAVLADSHLDLVGEIDALDLLQKSMHEMLTRLLALGDDVDAGVLLQLERQHGRVALGARKLRARRLPRRPQHVRLGKPFRLRQGAGDRGWKQHRCSPGLFLI
jgi:hypothetical protein